MRIPVLFSLSIFLVVNFLYAGNNASVTSVEYADSSTSDSGNVAFENTRFSPSRSDSTDKNLFYPNKQSNILLQNDSLLRITRRDSLLQLEHQRRAVFMPTDDTLIAGEIDEHMLFTSDATSWSDISGFNRQFIVPRIGIAHNLNRLLFMGNTSPCNNFYSGSSLIPYTLKNPYSSESPFINHSFAHASISGGGTVRLERSLTHSVSPETFVFWENGPFDENILSFRSRRLIGRSTQISIYSRYQYFKGTTFSHDGNDIYTIFSKITPDTSVLSHKGYNPLVKDFDCGLDISWHGKRSSLFSTITYSDLSNELTANTPFVNNRPVFRRLTQYPLSLKSSYYLVPSPNTFIDFETRILINNMHIKDTLVATPLHVAIQSDDIAGSVRTGIIVNQRDSIDITATVTRYTTGVPDSTERKNYTLRPSLRYTRNLSLNTLNGSAVAAIGTDIFANENDTTIGMIWSAEVVTDLFNNRCNLYIRQDVTHYLPHYDSLDISQFIHDTHLRTGISIERSVKHASFSLGYQFYPDPDLAGISRTWINGTAPYDQPQSVLLLGGSVGRLSGLTLNSSIMISDTRPTLKVHASLSYLVIPKKTKQAIEVIAGMNYWSTRDKLTFADTSLWGREVLDISLSTSVHIKTFRLFYKIDNLLNRNYSYIPGFFFSGYNI